MTRAVSRHASAAFNRLPLVVLRNSGLCIILLGLCEPTHAQSASDLYTKAERMYEQGDPYRAAPLFAQAEQQFHTAGDRRDELAAKLGRLHAEADHGHYKAVKAEVEHDLANPLVQNDPHLRIQALSLLGIIDLNIDTEAAGSDWAQLLDVATAAHDLKWENRARGELGLVAGLKGDIGKAGIALFKAIGTAEQIGDVSGAITFRVWLANGMAVNGMPEAALKQLDQAIALAQQHGYEQLPFQLIIAKIRAIALLPEPERSKRVPEAKRLFAETLKIAEDEKVYGAEIELLAQSGQLAAQSGTYVEAEHAFTRAASVAGIAGLKGLEADNELRLANLYLQMQEPQKAAASIAEGMREIDGAEQAYDLPSFIAAEADTQAALGNIRAADALYGRATTLVEGLLVNAPSSQLRSSMISAFSRIYVAHFRLAWDKEHNAVKAFQIIESARGRVLLDAIRNGRSSSAMSPSRPEMKIAQLQRKLVANSLSDAQQKRVLAEIDGAYDALSASQFGQERTPEAPMHVRPVSLSTLTGLLTPNQVFVEYVLDRSASYAIEVSSAGMMVHQLPQSREIAGLVRSYLQDVKAGKNGAAQARSLYSALIAPIAAHNWNSLILVPDGSLHLLPLGALMDDTGEYLLQRASVYVAPSASVLAKIKREPEQRAEKPFLGVAFSEVSHDPEPVATSRGMSDIRSRDIKPLQFSGEEVYKANLALGGDGVVLQGPDASEVKLKAEPLSEFRVIHIAAHGVGDEIEPDRAAIVLHPGSAIEDGLWQAREIRRTRLNADVVVLSACETGTGRLEGEEGIMNLARAFLTAGGKSVVASLWDVDDRSTATIMEDFYEHLAKGKSIASALRSSQLQFIQTYGDKASPYLWAGFEVIGDGTRTITTKTKGAELQAAREHLQ